MDRCRKAAGQMLSKSLAFGAILTCLRTRSKARCLALSIHGTRIKARKLRRKQQGI